MYIFEKGKSKFALILLSGFRKDFYIKFCAETLTT
jgi:hypothetical protein